MSQRASQQAENVQLNGFHVTQYIQNMQQRDAAIVQTFRACRDTVMDAVQLYSDEKDEALLGKLREQFLTLIQAEHQIEQHQAALGQLQHTYQPSLDKTDFQATLQQHMQQARASDGFDPAADDDLKLFDELAGNEQQQEQEQEMDEDDELMVVGNVDKNDRCPYTLKDIAELDNPVEDQKGFIYERSAIVAAINQAQQHDHCNWVECPLPGVSHAVMLHHLKPVNKRRLQMQAQRRPTQPDRRGVVLDV